MKNKNINFKTFSKCEGYKSLKKSVLYEIYKRSSKNEKCFNLSGCNKKKSKCFHLYCNKFKWIIDRVRHYSYMTGLKPEIILNTWEKNRKFWYMNYYQECSFLKMNKKNKFIFIENINKFKIKYGIDGHFCLKEKRVETDPLNCLFCKYKKEKKELLYIFDLETCLFDKMCMPIAYKKSLSVKS